MGMGCWCAGVAGPPAAKRVETSSPERTTQLSHSYVGIAAGYTGFGRLCGML